MNMKYVSVLRGINVSGQKKIKMADLKALYESVGLKDVSTYIQSGNVIFKSDIKPVSKIQESLEKAIASQYKFHVPIELRTFKELTKIIETCPYSAIDPEVDGTKVLVSFLSAKPKQEDVSKLLSFVSDPEKLTVNGREVYLYCPTGYGKSKLSNNFVEKVLCVDATTRNWKTVLKLHEMLV